MGFELQTYAGAVEYVPDFLDNRTRFQAGKDFFWVKILVLNDAEFHKVRKTISSEDAMSLDFEILEKHCTEVHNFSIKSTNGEVLIPKSGKDLLNGVRSHMDNISFSRLAADIVKATINHSKLSEGEKTASAS